MTCRHRVAIHTEGLVGVAENYLKKGLKIYIEGRLETRKWTDREGHENYTTEIVLRPYAGQLLMLDARKDETGNADEPADDMPY
jgi:single-strand DNA-binding protein